MKITIIPGHTPHLDQCARRVKDNMEALRELDWVAPRSKRAARPVLLFVAVLLALGLGFLISAQ
jgi:hypothetical protein